MDSKPFWQSKTFWANVIGIVAAVAGVFGIDALTPEMQTTMVGVIMGGVNIALRFISSSAVTVK